MADLTITFHTTRRWWFSPLLGVVGWLMEHQWMPEDWALAIARWAGAHGLKIS